MVLVIYLLIVVVHKSHLKQEQFMASGHGEQPNIEIYIRDFSDYLAGKKSRSQNTITSYGRDIRQFIAFLRQENLAYDKIEKINRTNVMSYILYLQKTKKSTATVLRSVASLKAFYKYLMNRGVVKSDPTLDIETPKAEKKPPAVLSLDEVELLLRQPEGDCPKSKRDKAMLEVLYATGIRCSELIRLKISDVNLEAKYITCNFINKERIIPLGSQAVLSLRIYINEARNEIVKDANETSLFLNNSGNPMTRQGFWKIVKSYAEKANILAPITPQVLRHCFAAHLVANGADLNSVKEMMGHADISSTQIYMQHKHKLMDVYASAHPRYNYREDEIVK